MPRLLLFNPNTDAALTARLVAIARRQLPDWAVRGMTAPRGARYIASPKALRMAGMVAMDCLAGLDLAGCDAVLLACFGDPALDALRRALSAPVFGMAESGFAACAAPGGRFAVVTGGADWPPLIRDLADRTGYGRSLADVRAIPHFGRAAQADPHGTLGALAAEALIAIERTGAERILLGGTGLAGFRDALAARLAVPVHCSLTETLRAVVSHMAARG
ncbi:aspartate/glutamate racemase family protein [Nguyenibacter vanlangensis]|uniref:Aspartate/glutamate racemase family protein n=2 Tax=Nguyenibacter vanlangensis TaxID=1216886 RepID=A0ABZ3D8T3_9PROT